MPQNASSPPSAFPGFPSGFSLPWSGGGENAEFIPAALAGKIAVFYFYPRDNTPGCTLEAQEFRDLYPEFLAAGAEIFGVSRDSLQSHDKFRAKQALPFPLLADTEEALCRLFDVIRQKTLYGKPVRGIERSTFVFDRAGVLCREWRGVKAAGHAQAVLDFVRSL
ncbi:MAG: peroxiredoxin [Zoogloeaceae bacterium]|jgi:peroxiredoxin Q/BCP|nr:peroxiredoxin [Zoogloeaceae bacterium]